VRGAQHHHQPRIGQRMGHRHEVVLPAHAADHLAASSASLAAAPSSVTIIVVFMKRALTRCARFRSPGWP
jgi:hypothetical protein